MSHDVSGDKVSLDFSVLIETARIAVGQSRAACERALGEFQQKSISISFASDCLFASQKLAEASRQLANASETLFALEASRTRRKLEIVTKNN